MYLLATDYDGTLKKNNHSLYLNLDAIDRFRNQGNKLAIVTGRSFSSIKKEILNYDINYDYVSCNNGLIVFDNNDNIINRKTLDNKIANIILDELEKDDSVVHINTYGDYEKVNNINNILEFSVRFKSRRQALLFKKYIEDKLKEVRCINFENRLFIGSDITKKDAVSFIHNLENIDKIKVYTIGDDINDLEMLKEFNGYKIFNTNPRMIFNNIPVTKDVYTLIKKIDKKV